MWSVARFQLGLSDEEFFDITPLQFEYLTKRYEQERDTLDFRAGIVASTVANCNRGKGQKAFKPKDFMPDYGGADSKATKGPNQMKMMAMTLNALYGGTFDGKPNNPKKVGHGRTSNR